MPVPDVKTNIQNILVTATNPAGGAPGGSRVSAPSPVRGRIIEAGFMPNSLVASAMTMALNVGTQVSSAAANFANVISSTLATFSSTNLYEGATASATPPSNAYVNAGDPIQWVTSGGNTSAIGVTTYAIIRRG